MKPQTSTRCMTRPERRRSDEGVSEIHPHGCVAQSCLELGDVQAEVRIVDVKSSDSSPQGAAWSFAWTKIHE